MGEEKRGGFCRGKDYKFIGVRRIGFGFRP